MHGAIHERAAKRGMPTTMLNTSEFCLKKLAEQHSQIAPIRRISLGFAAEEGVVHLKHWPARSAKHGVSAYQKCSGSQRSSIRTTMKHTLQYWCPSTT